MTNAMLLFGLLFVGLGAWFVIKSNFFGLVFITFGLSGLLFVKHDFTNYKGKSRSHNYWLLAHLQRMTGGYIAALTAFLVVNGKYFPLQRSSFLFWLLPTIILVPLIIGSEQEIRIKKIRP